MSIRLKVTIDQKLPEVLAHGILTYVFLASFLAYHLKICELAYHMRARILFCSLWCFVVVGKSVSPSSVRMMIKRCPVFAA